MTREWFESPDTKWQKLNGNAPGAVLDTHPSGDYVAMQIGPKGNIGTERAAVWKTKTHKIHWNPGNANALCWIEKGNEILILEEHSNEDVIRSPLLVTPTQTEYRHFVRRLSWPGLDTISCTELKFPLGWLVDIIPSPTDKVACFVWQDQCESGIEFLSWEQGKLHQLQKIGFCMNSNRMQGPVFSEDGTIIAMTFGAGIWWAKAPDKPSPGGKRNVGYIIWSETASGIYKRTDIDVCIPEGWRPNNPANVLYNELLSVPVFLNPHEVKVILPTGEERFIML